MSDPDGRLEPQGGGNARGSADLLKAVGLSPLLGRKALERWSYLALSLPLILQLSVSGHPAGSVLQALVSCAPPLDTIQK